MQEGGWQLAILSLSHITPAVTDTLRFSHGDYLRVRRVLAGYRQRILGYPSRLRSRGSGYPNPGPARRVDGPVRRVSWGDPGLEYQARTGSSVGSGQISLGHDLIS